jgi:hypothetical protein
LLVLQKTHIFSPEKVNHYIQSYPPIGGPNQDESDGSLVEATNFARLDGALLANVGLAKAPYPCWVSVGLISKFPKFFVFP